MKTEGALGCARVSDWRHPDISLGPGLGGVLEPGVFCW